MGVPRIKELNDGAPVLVRLPASLRERLEARAVADERPLSHVVRKAIEAYLDDVEAEAA